MKCEHFPSGHVVRLVVQNTFFTLVLMDNCFFFKNPENVHREWIFNNYMYLITAFFDDCDRYYHDHFLALRSNVILFKAALTLHHIIQYQQKLQKWNLQV